VHFNKRARNWQTSTRTALAVVLRFIAFRKWRHYFFDICRPGPNYRISDADFDTSLRFEIRRQVYLPSCRREFYHTGQHVQ